MAKYYFRSIMLIPFTLWAWVFCSEYINPFNFDWHRLDDLGLRAYHLFQALVVGIPIALILGIKRSILAFAGSAAALPEDITAFTTFVGKKFFRHCVDSSLPPPDPFCSTTLFHDVRFQRYIPIYDIFAIVKGAAGFYIATRAFWQGPIRTWVLGLTGVWWCYSKFLSLHKYAGMSLCVFSLSIWASLVLLSKLGAPVYLDLAHNIPDAWKYWVFFETLRALFSVCSFLLLRRQTPLPDWPHHRQRYLNLVNRLLIWLDHGEEFLWETEDKYGTERTIDIVEVLLG